jgi:hypothetical protein
VSAQLSPEEVVRKFFDCYTNGRPEDFDQVVAPDYLDYGHTPPGRGPGGARDDYQNAVKRTDVVIGSAIDPLAADGDVVAPVGQAHCPAALRSACTGPPADCTDRGRHALIGATPS